MQAMSSSLFWSDRTGSGRTSSACSSCSPSPLHAVSTYVAHRPRRQVVPAMLLTAVHAARMGAAYLLMLAVMSFNGGVLLAAVAGHALGFLLTGSWASSRAEELEHGHGAGVGAARGRDLVPPPSDDAAIA